MIRSLRRAISRTSNALKIRLTLQLRSEVSMLTAATSPIAVRPVDGSRARSWITRAAGGEDATT
jgi:hypothetical protein